MGGRQSGGIADVSAETAGGVETAEMAGTVVWVLGLAAESMVYAFLGNWAQCVPVARLALFYQA